MIQTFLTEGGTPGSNESNPSLEELLAFERLLSDLSASFAIVAGDRVVAEIEAALKRLLEFLGFDRSAFWEFIDEETPYFLCSVAVKGVALPMRGPIPAELSWFASELRARRTIVIRSGEDIPPQATAAVEYNRRAGIRSVLVIPLPVGGRVVAAIGFGALRSTREWPAEFIARVTVIGEVMAQALARARSEAALRASEERWRSVLENPIFGISLVDHQHRFIATNRTFQTMIGYTDKELLQLTPLDISIPGEREVNAILFKELQQGQRQHYEMVKQLRRKDGRLIWIQLYVFAIPDVETKARFTFGMMLDITGNKQSQDALQAMRAELDRVERLNRLSAMTASIAHEINQPLAAMVANANAAQRWLANATPGHLEETRAALKQINNDGHRAAELIQGVRAMFRNDGQKRVVIDINKLVREVLELAQDELLKHHISVEMELNDELPTAMADRIQLQQVILNLITNAIDAMEPVTDRPRILRVKSEIGDRGASLVSFEDTGTGIDPDNMNRIFDTYFTTKPSGMGVGLSICRSIVEAHNGRLWASTGALHGSVFRLELPTKYELGASRAHPENTAPQ